MFFSQNLSFFKKRPKIGELNKLFVYIRHHYDTVSQFTTVNKSMFTFVLYDPKCAC